VLREGASPQVNRGGAGNSLSHALPVFDCRNETPMAAMVLPPGIHRFDTLSVVSMTSVIDSRAAVRTKDLTCRPHQPNG
jgi:hypothetical protein